MKRWLRAATLLVPGWLIAACGAPAPDANWIADRSRIGDTLTVRTTRGQVWSGPPHLTTSVVIGTLDGAPEYTFGEVSRLAEDGLGGIYVFDRQGPVLRHYDSLGVHVGALGRSGQGPGEYGSLSLGMVADANGVLYLSDWGNGRINRYSPSGEALDAWSLDAPFLTTARGRWVFSPAPGEILMRARYDDRHAFLVVRGGQVRDTLWVPELPGLPEQRGGPYSVEQYFGWHPNGHLLTGVNSSYVIEHRRSDLVVRFGRVVDALPVHPDEAAQWRRRFEWMESQPQYRAPLGEWIPEHMPPYSGLQAGDDGRVWVRRNVVPVEVPAEDAEGGPPQVTWEQPHVYDVFVADGRYLGEVRFSGDFEPLLFTDGAVWGVRRGAFDEEYVVRLRLSSDL